MQKKELKIISLNTWGGNVRQPLEDFLEKNKDVDIFCFQEVFNGGKDDETEKQLTNSSDNKNYNLLNDLKTILSNFNYYFRPHVKDHWGLSIFIKKDLAVSYEDEFFVHRDKGYLSKDHPGFHAKSVQYLKLNLKNKNINILNFHGLWNGKGKDDTEDRIKQSQNIVDFIKTLEGEIILCGDFNLNPDTESVKIIENFGLKNLIKENNISTTRTSLYVRRDVSPFADYAFVSKGVEVKSFEIMPDEVSDHSPMKLIINI